MTCILITGISGVGKSTVIEELAVRGYAAVDLDSNAFSTWIDVEDDSATPGTPVEPHRDWVWHEERVQALLSAYRTGQLFVSGCVSNMGKFRPQFDRTVLLSAPAATIVTRLATRTNNAYGKRPDEVVRVLELMTSVEPLLRKVADVEIDTSALLDEVVAQIIRVATTV
jgi:dephospho-CoA kinase